jgi:hypothetical protein
MKTFEIVAEISSSLSLGHKKGKISNKKLKVDHIFYKEKWSGFARSVSFSCGLISRLIGHN